MDFYLLFYEKIQGDFFFLLFTDEIGHICLVFFFHVLALLDDLDKELNNYIMRCREWYGWHFPELGKIVTDNLVYCKTVRKVGKKDFSHLIVVLINPISPLS